MARTPIQLALRKLKRTQFKRGRLQFGNWRIDILPTGRWYLCVDAMPREAGSWQSVEGAKRASLKALRRRIRNGETLTSKTKAAA